MTSKSCHFSDPMKKSFLQNDVSNLKHFREVKLAESVGIAQSQGPIPYPNYVILLQSAATQFDKSNSLRQGNRQSLINQNEQNFIPDHFHSNDDNFPSNHWQDEVDQNFGSFAAYTTATSRPPFHRRRPSLRKEVWSKLPQADQTAWDQLSDFAKWSIINNCSYLK